MGRDLKLRQHAGLNSIRGGGSGPVEVLDQEVAPHALLAGASDYLRCSRLTNRLPPHPGPLPLRGGEGESTAGRPHRWRRKSSNGLVLAIAEPTAPTDSLSPSEGERAGVRGRGKLKIENYQLPIFNLAVRHCHWVCGLKPKADSTVEHVAIMAVQIGIESAFGKK